VKKYILRQLESNKSFDIEAFVDDRLVGNATVFGLGNKVKRWYISKFTYDDKSPLIKQ
jgi:hypothetical protein